MKECEEKLKSAHLRRVSQLARDWRVARSGTRVKHAEELKGHASYCITRQNFQSGQAISLQHKLATRFSH